MLGTRRKPAPGPACVQGLLVQRPEASSQPRPHRLPRPRSAAVRAPQAVCFPWLGAEGFTRSVTLEQLSPWPAGDALARRILVSARRCQGPVRELVSPPARRACLFEGDRTSERHVNGLVAEAEAVYLVPPFHGYSGGFPETKAPCASRPKSHWVPAGLCGRSCCVQSPRVAGAATAGVRAHGVSTFPRRDVHTSDQSPHGAHTEVCSARVLSRHRGPPSPQGTSLGLRMGLACQVGPQLGANPGPPLEPRARVEYCATLKASGRGRNPSGLLWGQ